MTEQSPSKKEHFFIVTIDRIIRKIYITIHRNKRRTAALQTLLMSFTGGTFMETKKIPYKIYLNEEEMPQQWYNMRADMKNKPAPLLNPGTLKRS